MNVLYKDNPVKKMEYILNLAASGMSNREIAEELGYKDVHGLYTFMRRQGMPWNPKKRLYVVQGESAKDDDEGAAEPKPAGKVGRIISMFERKMDAKEIAKSLRFGSHQEMADYMKSKGYRWDNKQGNYVKALPTAKDELVSTSSIEMEGKGFMEEYGGILKLLKDNESRLSDIMMMSGDNQSIPRHTISGYNITKSTVIPSSLDQLVRDFSRDRDIPQKEILKTALVEFLKKYGYAYEVKTVLHI